MRVGVCGVCVCLGALKKKKMKKMKKRGEKKKIIIIIPQCPVYHKLPQPRGPPARPYLPNPLASWAATAQGSTPYPLLAPKKT